jgi:hypothetical protein
LRQQRLAIHSLVGPAGRTEAIPDLKSLWRSKSLEELEQGLDYAQSVIFQALQSKDFRTRLRAARLMLRTRAARERGWR